VLRRAPTVAKRCWNTPEGRRVERQAKSLKFPTTCSAKFPRKRSFSMPGFQKPAGVLMPQFGVARLDRQSSDSVDKSGSSYPYLFRVRQSIDPETRDREYEIAKTRRRELTPKTATCLMVDMTCVL
jgi:hypothetical protein